MSKGNSGHFSGTKGEKQLRGSASQMHAQVSSWAQSTAARLEAKSKRQRDKFNTATVIYDESTGKYYNGRNRGIEIDHEKKNPILFGDATHDGLLPRSSLNEYSLGNCAEMQAVNRALNDGANLGNLKMYTIHTTKNSFGKSKPACKNCTYTLKNRTSKITQDGQKESKDNEKKL